MMFDVEVLFKEIKKLNTAKISSKPLEQVLEYPAGRIIDQLSPEYKLLLAKKLIGEINKNLQGFSFVIKSQVK